MIGNRDRIHTLEESAVHSNLVVAFHMDLCMDPCMDLSVVAVDKDVSCHRDHMVCICLEVEGICSKDHNRGLHRGPVVVDTYLAVDVKDRRRQISP